MRNTMQADNHVETDTHDVSVSDSQGVNATNDSQLYTHSDSNVILVGQQTMETMEEKKRVMRENILKMKQQLQKQQEDEEYKELLHEEQELRRQLSVSEESTSTTASKKTLKNSPVRAEVV